MNKSLLAAQSGGGGELTSKDLDRSESVGHG
nr:MAG TPA: hypothetical protein [Caudoviricetes sp.]